MNDSNNHENEFHEQMVSEYIPFDVERASVLGLNTNGCVPTQVYGLIVEGQIDTYKGDVDESFWLKAVTNPDFSHIAGRNVDVVPSNDVDFIAFGDAEQIANILGTVVNASLVEGHNVVTSKKFTSYFSDAQRRADPNETTDVAIDDCALASKNTKDGFEISFSDHAEVISRLNASLDADGIKSTLRVANEIRDWKRSIYAVIDAASEQNAEDDNEVSVAVPGR